MTKYAIVKARIEELLETKARLSAVLVWLRRNANAEKEPKARAAFIEAHNAALKLAEDKSEKLSTVFEASYTELQEARAEIERLRAVLEEFTDAEHHSPPVPLWISAKARAVLEK